MTGVIGCPRSSKMNDREPDGCEKRGKIGSPSDSKGSLEIQSRDG